jgi:hypothetical protein
VSALGWSGTHPEFCQALKVEEEGKRRARLRGSRWLNLTRENSTHHSEFCEALKGLAREVCKLGASRYGAILARNVGCGREGNHWANTQFSQALKRVGHEPADKMLSARFRIRAGPAILQNSL